MPEPGDAPPQAQNEAAAASQAKFAQGVALHQQGQLAAAERIYEEVLRQQPNHFDALHLLGIIALQTRRTERAVELIRRAIGLDAKIAAVHSNLGSGLRDLKRPDEALTSYEKAIALKPDYAEAYNNRGNALLDLKRLDEALASYDRAIALKPDYAQAYNNRGRVLLDLRRPADALMSYDKAIALRSDYTEAYYARGVVLMDLKRPEEALTSYDKAIALRPDYTEAYYSRGVALRDLKHVDQALASYDRAIAIKPDYAEAYNNRGNALTDLKRPEEALASYDKAIALKPDYAEAYNNRGNALQNLKRPADALASYDRVIALKPDYAEAYNNRGNALVDLKRFVEALASCDKAIALKCDFAEAYYNRSNALLDLKRSMEALASSDKAIAVKPNFAEAYYNRGNALTDLKRPEEALASYDRAIALKPDYAEAYCGRGNALQNLMRPADALASYDKAIALKADYAEAYAIRGTALLNLRHLSDALANYDMAIALKPNLAEVEGLRLHAKMHLGDWRKFDNECAHLISAVRSGNVNTPFVFLAIPSTSDDQLRCARLYIADKYPPSDKPIWQGERYKHDRIRVAYVSADFRQHPVSLLMAGMFELHDKSRFDVTAISIGPDDKSEIRQRVKASFEHFIDAETYSDDQIANLVKELEIDILVDLMGFTTDSRTDIFARRSAPLQVNHLGYPGTMGAEYIDYIIADRIVIPEAQQYCYAEKIVYLPNSFQPTDRKRRIADRIFTRAEVGLPQEGVVFCCFNSNYKITPAVFDIWMRILKQVKGSVLWLVAESPAFARNVAREAVARGVDANRLSFAPRMSLPEHQARLCLADVFLDTLPYNAGTTASDMLWAGLPVLTCIGNTFVGRMAASVLNAICMPELITTTPEAYEQKAIDLATHPEKLAFVKRKLGENRLITPLFDTKLFTKHIEAAYTAIFERHRAGLAPDHIIIPN